MDFKALLHQISQIYQKLSLKQKIVAGSSIVLVVAFLVFLTLYKSKSDSFAGYSVLFENISPSDSALIVDQLNKDGIKYKLANPIPHKSIFFLPFFSVKGGIGMGFGVGVGSIIMVSS